jgi:UDP-glucose 6-dehydrogenase
LSWFVGGTKFPVIGCNVGGCDVAVGLQEMRDDMLGCDVGKSSVPVLERSHVDFFDGVDELLFECSINVLVFSPQA